MSAYCKVACQVHAYESVGFLQIGVLAPCKFRATGRRHAILIVRLPSGPREKSHGGAHGGFVTRRRAPPHGVTRRCTRHPGHGTAPHGATRCHTAAHTAAGTRHIVRHW
eukprot:gene12737-biopygen4536